MTDFELIDGLMAYDCGAADSGIHDSIAKLDLKDRLREMGDKAFDDLCCEYVIHLISPRMRNQGYGIEDVRVFIEWMSREMGMDI